MFNLFGLFGERTRLRKEIADLRCEVHEWRESCLKSWHKVRLTGLQLDQAVLGLSAADETMRATLAYAGAGGIP